MAGSHPFTKLLCGKCRIQCFQRTKSQDILDSGTLILTVFFFCFFFGSVSYESTNFSEVAH